MEKITVNQVIEDLNDAVLSIAGEEYEIDLNITEDSKLSEALDLDSVEITRVFEYILNKYDKAPIVDWISEMEVDEIMEMKVRDLTEFIQKSYE